MNLPVKGNNIIKTNAPIAITHSNIHNMELYTKGSVSRVI